MVWRVYLAGEERDLSRLREELTEGALVVASDDEARQTYLRADEFESLATADEVRQAALPKIAVLNGISAVLAPRSGSVSFDGTISNVGSRHVFVADSMELTDSVVPTRGVTIFAEVASVVVASGSLSGFVSGGTAAPRPLTPTMSRYVQLVAHPELVEVYRILGSVEKPKWVEFYKVYELLCQAAGGSDHNLSLRTGVSQAQIGRFTASANHQAISGDDARHATMRGTPGAGTGLTLEEGRAVIDQLIQGFAR